MHYCHVVYELIVMYIILDSTHIFHVRFLQSSHDSCRIHFDPLFRIFFIRKSEESRNLAGGEGGSGWRGVQESG